MTAPSLPWPLPEPDLPPLSDDQGNVLPPGTAYTDSTGRVWTAAIVACGGVPMPVWINTTNPAEATT